MSSAERIGDGVAKRASWWALVPVVLLAAMLAGLGSMAAIAVDDPSFAVEKDYYKKAVAWDRELEQRAENTRLGWKIAVQTDALRADHLRVVAGILDSRGLPVVGAQVRLEAFHNARAAERYAVTLREAEGARYTGEFPFERAGLWELRIVVTRGRDRFTETIRAELPQPRSGS